MLEEIGAPYENVPVLEDGPFVLFESLAINLYLAKRFPSELSARSLEEEFAALDWSLWCEPELERRLATTASLEDVPSDWLDGVLLALDTALASHGHLIA